MKLAKLSSSLYWFCSTGWWRYRKAFFCSFKVKFELCWFYWYILHQLRCNERPNQKWNWFIALFGFPLFCVGVLKKTMFWPRNFAYASYSCYYFDQDSQQALLLCTVYLSSFIHRHLRCKFISCFMLFEHQVAFNKNIRLTFLLT